MKPHGCEEGHDELGTVRENDRYYVAAAHAETAKVGRPSACFLFKIQMADAPISLDDSRL
jgi:hypothetical protein